MYSMTNFISMYKSLNSDNRPGIVAGKIMMYKANGLETMSVHVH